MDFLEVLILFASIFYTIKFFITWYRSLLVGIYVRRSIFPRVLLFSIPICALIIIIYTLENLASFDVVDSSIYALFYTLVGLAWLYLGTFLMFYCFDLSWVDDAVGMNNSAAAIAVFGGGLGITLIYAGANIGDGPGWWCVFFAGGLGLVAWLALGIAIEYATSIFRRITVERDVPTGIRTGAYLLSSGIILARASAGDWTSYSKTIVEFFDGWPVLILAIVFVLTEMAFKSLRLKEGERAKPLKWIVSLVLGAAFIVSAIYVLRILPPLPVNPMYQ